MEKNKVILGASLGVLGAFIYYYSNKKGKDFLKATGGYGTGGYSTTCTNLTAGCKTISSCKQKKLNEIKCQLKKDTIAFNKIKQEAFAQGVSVTKMLHLVAMKTFTNDGKRNIKESLEYYKILPTELAEKQYWEQFFNTPELKEIISGINSNPALLYDLSIKAKTQNTTLDRQIRMAAMKIYRQNVIQRRREARQAKKQQQQSQQNQQQIKTTYGYQTYIDGYGNVDVVNLTPAQFSNLATKLVDDPYSTFARLSEQCKNPLGCTYQVGSGSVGGSGGGGSLGDSCGGYSWGSFNWSWCRTMAAMRSGGNTGGYS
jgi:hypothetical protein